MFGYLLIHSFVSAEYQYPKTVDIVLSLLNILFGETFYGKKFFSTKSSR